MYTAPQRSCGAEYTPASQTYTPEISGFRRPEMQVFTPKLRFGVKIKSFHCKFTVRCKHLTVLHWLRQCSKFAIPQPTTVGCGLWYVVHQVVAQCMQATRSLLCAASQPKVVMQQYHSRCTTCCVSVKSGLPPDFTLMHQVYHLWCYAAIAATQQNIMQANLLDFRIAGRMPQITYLEAVIGTILLNFSF